MDDKLIKQVLHQYKIKPARILKYEKGYRNRAYPVIARDGRKYNLVLYKSEKGILQKIRSANKVSELLANQGFPCRVVKTNAGKSILRIAAGPVNRRVSRYVCVYNYLPGKTIAWEAYTQKHIKLLGKTLSDMHWALRDFDHTGLQDACDIMFRQNQEMAHYFANPGVQNALQAKLSLKINRSIFKRHAKLIKELSKIKQRSALHLDFVRSNVLFAKDSEENLQITGILDFEKVACGPAIIDIARTLAFLITDCKFKQEKKVRKYFLLSGYQKRGKQDLANLNYLDYTMEFFWFYDFYKFLLHNPYEDLKDNEHFVRTRAKLLD
jgi:Ser/Thr protein kinase RdoA (MazF antagonist)